MKSISFWLKYLTDATFRFHVDMYDAQKAHNDLYNMMMEKRDHEYRTALMHQFPQLTEEELESVYQFNRKCFRHENQ